MPASPARRTRLLGLGVAAVLVGTATGCTTSRDAEPTAAPTPIAQLDTETMTLARIDFCGVVPPTAVRTVLGEPAHDLESYGNGEHPSIDGVPDDVVHEVGCVWSADSGWEARAWVFAQPVTSALARTVVADAGSTTGCQTPGGADFGAPSYLQVCTKGIADEGVRVHRGGLFGETWLGCEIIGPKGTDTEQVRSRTDRWCVSVANALDTGS